LEEENSRGAFSSTRKTIPSVISLFINSLSLALPQFSALRIFLLLPTFASRARKTNPSRRSCGSRRMMMETKNISPSSLFLPHASCRVLLLLILLLLLLFLEMLSFQINNRNRELLLLLLPPATLKIYLFPFSQIM